MSTGHERPAGVDAADDAGIEELLREVGSREEPATELTDDVRRAVHGEWRAVVDRRARRRRVVTFGIAASVAAGVLAVAIGTRYGGPAPVPVAVASIARVEGTLAVSAQDEAWHSVAAGRVLMSGERVRTGRGARAALDLGHGLSVRLAENSLAALERGDRIRLEQGTLYVDADPVLARATPLAIVTAAGSVRHVGTQYMVETGSDGVIVSVREGRVEIASRSGSHGVRAGERVSVSHDGSARSATLDAHDRRWQWAGGIAPAFDIDQQPLASFLAWAARETGRKVVYADARAEQAARQLVLRGSIGPLDPEAALAAVLATTTLKRIETNAESIGIALADSIDPPAEARPTP